MTLEKRRVRKGIASSLAETLRKHSLKSNLLYNRNFSFYVLFTTKVAGQKQQVQGCTETKLYCNKARNECTTLHRGTVVQSLLLLLITSGLSPGGSGYFTCIQNMKFVINKFKSGGLHEKHVVATWNLGNHLSICL